LNTGICINNLVKVLDTLAHGGREPSFQLSPCWNGVHGKAGLLASARKTMERMYASRVRKESILG